MSNTLVLQMTGPPTQLCSIRGKGELKIKSEQNISEPSGRLRRSTESVVLGNNLCSMQALILPLQYKPASCSSWNTQLVVVLEMAAFPSIRSFLAAFPAVIWSLDCIRTHPGISGSSYTSFVLPSLTFLPSFSSREKNKIKSVLDAKSFGRVRQHA